ncbi:MAG: hypothetical protein PHS23_08975, partial [Candidatus Cloacimonetes bacterium]|nr:hypothetical protein [Candidatus Cloacimonadota bacterium]
MKIGNSNWLGLVLACFIICPTLIWAQFAGGSGNPGSPYQIANANQLNRIRQYPNAHFVLTGDIDLASYNQGTGWQPIGSSANPFTGSLDGADFAILGLFTAAPAVDYQALFAYTDNAILKNIRLSGVNVTGQNYCAALVAVAQHSQIINCHVEGSVLGASNCGALAGSLELSSSISQCSVDAEVSGSFATGGLCGYLKDSSILSSSCSRGSVNGQNAVGGLVGINAASQILNSYSAASVQGSRYVAGLLGTNDYQGLVENCYSYGEVVGTQNTGGLIGRSVLGLVSGSYWNLDTSGQTTSAGGEGLTAQQMLPPYQGNVFVAWDFTSIWAAHPTYNEGYPYLGWEYTVPTSIALLVYDRNNINAYDSGFINVFNTITTDYEMIDIDEISSGQKNLNNYAVVISNFMGYGNNAHTAFDSIAQKLEAATQAGTEFIVGSESVAIPIVLGLANGAMNGNWGPALNDTRAISNIANIDAISQGVNPIPNYQSYLGQDGNMLANYFGTGVFWKVMTNFSGNFYTQSSYNSYPIFRFNTIWSSFNVTGYQYPDGPMEYQLNNSRILNLKRFWTQNNETRLRGWIGPEGIQILSNAISHYLATDFVETPPSELGEVFYSINGSQCTIHWDAVAEADFYEIWYSTNGTNWSPIGLQSEDGSGSYAWLSPITTTNLYRVRPILGDTPGTFVDAIEAIPQEAYIAVTPQFIEHNLLQDSTDQVELEITNSGNAALNWTASIEDVRRETTTALTPRPRVTAELRPERESRPGMEKFRQSRPEESERESSLLRDRDTSLFLDPDNGMVEADSTMFCYLYIDATGSLSGSYEYQIVVSSNAVN